MFKKLHDIAKEYVKKDFVQDKFDEIYPFGLSDLPNVKYKSFGEKNPDKTFYVIYREAMHSGFFSNFDCIVRHIKSIEGTNLIPVVDFKNFKTLYNEENPINDTQNAWEYYFEQPSGYSLEEVYQSKHVLFCDGQFPHNIKIKPEEINEAYKKAFKVKNYVLDLVNKYEEKFENNKVVGVHFRGKDMNICPNHWFGPTIKQMFKYTDEIITKYNIDKIFLITEEKLYLDAFIKKYGNMVIYSDALRVPKINIFNITPRENHRYLLGLEVLIDFILLLKCKGILSTKSNIGDIAKIINSDYDFSYYLYNGSNSKNRYIAKYLYRIKKLLPKGFGGLLDEIKIIENMG